MTVLFPVFFFLFEWKSKIEAKTLLPWNQQQSLQLGILVWLLSPGVQDLSWFPKPDSFTVNPFALLMKEHIGWQEEAYWREFEHWSEKYSPFMAPGAFVLHCLDQWSLWCYKFITPPAPMWAMSWGGTNWKSYKGSAHFIEKPIQTPSTQCWNRDLTEERSVGTEFGSQTLTECWFICQTVVLPRMKSCFKEMS